MTLGRVLILPHEQNLRVQRSRDGRDRPRQRGCVAEPM